MYVLNLIQHQPLLCCILIGVAFASYCEFKIIRKSNSGVQAGS